jgi:hypothetical protein
VLKDLERGSHDLFMAGKAQKSLGICVSKCFGLKC